MFITDGQSPTVNTTNLFEMIDQNQEKLGRTILHLVYSPATSNNRTKQILTNIAKQHVPNWPVVSCLLLILMLKTNFEITA